MMPCIAQVIYMYVMTASAPVYYVHTLMMSPLPGQSLYSLAYIALSILVIRDAPYIYHQQNHDGVINPYRFLYLARCLIKHIREVTLV